MNHRTAERLRVLERDARNPGWIGGGGNALDGFLAVPCNSSGVDTWNLSKHEQLAGPFEQPPGYTLVSESRIYCAFGRDAAGNSVGVTWDWDYIVLAMKPYITSSIECSDTGGAIPPLGWSFRKEYYQPLYVIAYPILAPWAVPTPSSTPGWSLTFGSEPSTDFFNNLTGGSTVGFINPSTGAIDNYMAAGFGIDTSFPILNVTPTGGGGVSGYPVSLEFQLTSSNQFTITSGYWGVVPATLCNPGSYGDVYADSQRLTYLTCTNKPTGTIYGFGLYVLTLYDLIMLSTLNPASCWRTSAFGLEPNYLLGPVAHVLMDTTAEFQIDSETALDAIDAYEVDANDLSRWSYSWYGDYIHSYEAQRYAALGGVIPTGDKALVIDFLA